MDVDIDIDDHHIVKRGIYETCSEDQMAKKECCLKEVSVSFLSDFGWHFVIEPKTIRTNYCSGECSLDSLNKGTTPHSHFNLATGRPTCCTPTNYKDIEVLFVNEEDIVIQGKWSNLRATKCGCN
jgi:hypothetical protein